MGLSATACLALRRIDKRRAVYPSCSSQGLAENRQEFAFYRQEFAYQQALAAALITQPTY